MIVLRAVRCGYTHDDDSDDATSVTATSSAMATNNNNNDNATSADEGGDDMSEEVGDLDEGRYRWLQSLAPDFVHEECEDFHSTYTVIILFCVAVTFLIFTGCMLVEQIEAIQTNQGKIARMKMRVGQGGTELSRVTDEFNEMFGGNSPHVEWHWFVPLPVQFPGSYYKVVMGYEWDPTFDAVPYRQDDSADSTSDPSSTNGASERDPLQPPDLESGLSPENMDEVSLDTSETSALAMGSLKKRSVSNVSADALPELA